MSIITPKNANVMNLKELKYQLTSCTLDENKEVEYTQKLPVHDECRNNKHPRTQEPHYMKEKPPHYSLSRSKIIQELIIKGSEIHIESSFRTKLGTKQPVQLYSHNFSLQFHDPFYFHNNLINPIRFLLNKIKLRLIGLKTDSFTL
jgi:hypothetical protein